VIVCINQCGPKLKEIREGLEEIKSQPPDDTDEAWIKNFKDGNTGMAEALAQRFADKLNEHYRDKIIR